MMSRSPPTIRVLAGVNGAGKSSVGGKALRSMGGLYFNPDEYARRIHKEAKCSITEANALAWQLGKEQLEKAIDQGLDYNFETTLGGNTIPALLARAAVAGFDVIVWLIGLSSPEQHIARVRARVAAGGHDIPEEKIRERWNGSRNNLIALLPVLAEVKVFDNSRESGSDGRIPEPVIVLHCRRAKIVQPSLRRMRQTPEWAKPIVARALQLQGMAR